MQTATSRDKRTGHKITYTYTPVNTNLTSHLRLQPIKKLLFAASLFLLLYVSAVGASVECLSGEAARNAFVADKSEPYFSLLQPREMAAKTGAPIAAGTLQRQREKVRSTYRDAVLDCTPEDLRGLESYIAFIDAAVKPIYPGLVALPWRIVKVKNNIEGGLPHTRGNMIVFSESVLKSIALTAQNKQADPGYLNLLIHEQVHVIQRVKPKEFAALYEQQWGFRKVSAIRGADGWIASHQIVNPDAVDVLWVWPVPDTTKVIWPRVIFAGESPTPTMPDDFLLVGIELLSTADGYSVSTDKMDVPHFQNLSDESAYIKKFPGVSSLYHPNEIAADYLSDLALWDCLMDTRNASPEQQMAAEERFKLIRMWAKQTFAP
jgi:hypothetical protein